MDGMARGLNIDTTRCEDPFLDSKNLDILFCCDIATHS